MTRAIKNPSFKGDFTYITATKLLKRCFVFTKDAIAWKLAKLGHEGSNLSQQDRF